MRTEEKRFLLLLHDWAPPPRPLLPHLPGLGGHGLSSSPAARLQCSLVASSSFSAPTERRAVVVSIQETEASPTYEDQDDAVHRSLRHLWKRPPCRSSLSAVTATPPRCLLRYLRDFHRRGEVSPIRSYTTESRADTVRLLVVAGASRSCCGKIQQEGGWVGELEPGDGDRRAAQLFLPRLRRHSYGGRERGEGKVGGGADDGSPSLVSVAPLGFFGDRLHPAVRNIWEFFMFVIIEVSSMAITAAAIMTRINVLDKLGQTPLEALVQATRIERVLIY